MNGSHCDRCGRDVPLGAPRYRAVLEIAHVADTLEITQEDLRQDHAAEIRRLLAEMAFRDPREMEEEIYVRREYELCAPCRLDLLSALAPGRPKTARPRRRRPSRRR